AVLPLLVLSPTTLHRPLFHKKGNKSPTKWALIIIGIIIVSVINSCVDPVKPEYDFQENIIFIDAYAVTLEGQSAVKISRSAIEMEKFKIEEVEGAMVKMLNTVTGDELFLMEDDPGIYICPSEFAVQTGETWKLLIELLDGRTYESSPETVKAAVPIDNISSTYSKELVYDEGYKKFVPGHAVSIGWKDPAEEKNYYLWKYRSFEGLDICFTCDKGQLRGGVCEDTPQGPGKAPYYDYLCKAPCWMIRFSDEIQIFDDQLSDGATINSHHIANILYYRRQNVSVEIQQFSLTKSAYNYFKVVDDILNESNGLNAPPPVALFGNLFNPTDPDDLVLGQFTATSVSTKSIYIDRSELGTNPLAPDHPIILEPCVICHDSMRSYPCLDGRYRTSIKPEAWP
ncbi:MAG: DUF4249 domain-containing protein, partial [Bacteroidetes bacterium]|nr:DUF4249 domain-containing protein [Bacteroidota bacterium]